MGVPLPRPIAIPVNILEALAVLDIGYGMSKIYRENP
jgi:hypothetical protein